MALHHFPPKTVCGGTPYFLEATMSDEWDMKICCMGAGYVGGPTMAVIAKQCPKVRKLPTLHRRTCRQINERQTFFSALGNKWAAI